MLKNILIGNDVFREGLVRFCLGSVMMGDKGAVGIGRLVGISCGRAGLVGVGLCRLGSGWMGWI